MPDLPLDILYRDNDLVAIDKPSGLLVHPGREPEDKEWIAMKVLRDQIGERIYTVHRLDRPTSGVLLYCLNEPMANAMRALFEGQQVHKKYLALVRGCPPDGWENETFLQKAADHKLKASHTCFRRIAYHAAGCVSALPELEISLVEAEPRTGRHHQIRRHLVADGYPIVGDYLYGDTEANDQLAEAIGVTRMMLLAQELSFVHPYTAETVRIAAPIPEAFSRWM